MKNSSEGVINELRENQETKSSRFSSVSRFSTVIHLCTDMDS